MLFIFEYFEIILSFFLALIIFPKHLFWLTVNFSILVYNTTANKNVFNNLRLKAIITKKFKNGILLHVSANKQKKTKNKQIKFKY